MGSVVDLKKGSNGVARQSKGVQSTSLSSVPKNASKNKIGKTMWVKGEEGPSDGKDGKPPVVRKTGKAKIVSADNAEPVRKTPPRPVGKVAGKRRTQTRKAGKAKKMQPVIQVNPESEFEEIKPVPKKSRQAPFSVKAKGRSSLPAYMGVDKSDESDEDYVEESDEEMSDVDDDSSEEKESNEDEDINYRERRRNPPKRPGRRRSKSTPPA